MSFSNVEEIRKFMEPLGLPKLTDEQRDFLDSDITINEIKGVIHALPSSNFSTVLQPNWLYLY